MGIHVILSRLGKHRHNDDIEESCGVIDIYQDSAIMYRVVVDCGLHPNHAAKEGEKGWLAPDLDFFKDGKPIDAVLLTHAHTDHAGYAPALLPYMAPEAKFWMTRPTATILGHGFEDGLRIAERRGTEPAFTLAQMYECLDRIEMFNRRGAGRLFSTLELLVHPAGHINGACSFTFKVGDAIIHYAGDRCKHNQPGVLGAMALPKDWRRGKSKFVIAGWDCTYGADPESDLRDREAEWQRGYDLVAATVARGSIALVHGFAIHRGGSVAHELRRRGLGKPGVIALDGSCIYYAERQVQETGRWCEVDSPLNLPKSIVRVMGSRDRGWMVKSGNGRAVVTTHGMGGPGGPSTFWRRHVLEDPNAAMVFTGYVAPGTDGHKVLEADKKRKLTGQPVTVSFEVTDMETSIINIETYQLECHVEQIRIGSHDSRADILADIRDLTPDVAVLSHGSVEALTSLAGDLGDVPKIVRSDLEPSIRIDC